MTDTKREPLLSDLEWEHLLDAADVQSGMASKIIVDGVEAAHAMSMDRYDALIKALMYDLGRAYCIDKPSLKLAADMGFKPSND